MSESLSRTLDCRMLHQSMRSDLLESGAAALADHHRVLCIEAMQASFLRPGLASGVDGPTRLYRTLLISDVAHAKDTGRKKMVP